MDRSDISRRFEVLQGRISTAVERSGRSFSDVTIVAVTKNVAVEAILEACRLGLRHIGENRVQEAARKKAEIPAEKGITWHLIGSLQSNKAAKAADLFDVVQSLDSLPLAEKLNREAEKRGKRLPCLVEVKVSEEATKRGVSPEELGVFLEKAAAFPSLRLEGLMALAPYAEDPAAARPYFRRVREALERHRCFFSVDKPVLSLGMSHDFEAALEEGATMIRIGTALFGERTAKDEKNG